MHKPEEFTLLLVDDDEDILEFLSYNLKKEGYKVHTVDNGVDVLKKVESVKPDLIVLDIMMPGQDGIETCQQIRSTKGLEDIIIVFLTARGEDYSQIAGFDAGGDDYVAKPVKPKVLSKRIAALLKRSGKTSKSDENVIRCGDFVVDNERYLVIKDKEELILPRKEFVLFSLLASKPHKVFSREEIYNTVWGSDVVVGDRTIDVHIRKLREKVGKDHIVTIKGVGYKFQAE